VVLLGNGDGTFQPPVVYDSGSPFPYSVAISDLNRDGKLDLVVDHGVTNGGLDSLVSILLGNSDGTFQVAVTYDSGVHAAISVAVSDVGGDGTPDLLLAGDSGLGVLLGNGDGTFQPALTYGSGGSLATSVVGADPNGDGKLDLVAGNVYARNSLAGAVGVLLSHLYVCHRGVSFLQSESVLLRAEGQLDGKADDLRYGRSNRKRRFNGEVLPTSGALREALA